MSRSSSSRTNQSSRDDKYKSEKSSKDAPNKTSKDSVEMMNIFEDLKSKLSYTDMGSASGLDMLTETLKQLERLNESQAPTFSDKHKEKDNDTGTSRRRPRKREGDKSKPKRSTPESKRESPVTRRRESNSPNRSRRNSPNSRRKRSRSPSAEIRRRQSPSSRHRRDSGSPSRKTLKSISPLRWRDSVSPPRRKRDSVSPSRRRRDSESPHRRRRDNHEHYSRRSPIRRSRSNSPKISYRRRLSSMSPQRPQDHKIALSLSPVDESRNYNNSFSRRPGEGLPTPDVPRSDPLQQPHPAREEASNSSLHKETILPPFEGRGPPHYGPGRTDANRPPYHHRYFDYPPDGQLIYQGYPSDHLHYQPPPVVGGPPSHPGHPANLMGPLLNAVSGHPPMDGVFHLMGPDGMFAPHNMEMPAQPPMLGPGEFPPAMQQGLPPQHSAPQTQLVPTDGYTVPPAVENDDFLGNSLQIGWQEGKRWEEDDDIVFVPTTIPEPQSQVALQQEWEAAEDEKRKAVENEKKQQKLTLMKQRKEYIDKQTALRIDLEKLSKQKKMLLQEKGSSNKGRRVRENSREQLELENKLKAVANVIEMLSGIIGDDEVVEVTSVQPPHSRPVSDEQKSAGRPQSQIVDTPPPKTPPPSIPPMKLPPPVLPQLPLSPIIQRSPSSQSYNEIKITSGSAVVGRAEDVSSMKEPGVHQTTSRWRNSWQLPQEAKQTLSSKRSPEHPTQVQQREIAEQQRETSLWPKSTPGSAVKPDPEPTAESEPPKFNIVHFDPELHWCRVCNVFPRTAKEYLNHLHAADHKQILASRNLADMPWHNNHSQDEPVPSNKDGPSKRVPIKGLQFFVSASAWYCKLCGTWIGDLHCASIHLKSSRHSQQFANFTEKNPQWEVDWLTERIRAYEYSAEDRIRIEAQKQQPDNAIEEAQNQQQQDNKSESSTTHEQQKPAVKKEPKASKKSKKSSKKRSSSSSSDSTVSSCSTCDSNNSKTKSRKNKSSQKHTHKLKNKSLDKVKIPEVKSKWDSPEHDSDKKTSEIGESGKSDSPVHKLLNECMGIAKNLKPEELKDWISEVSGRMKLKAELIKSIEAIKQREARYKKHEEYKKSTDVKREVKPVRSDKTDKKPTDDNREDKSERCDRKDKKTSDDKKEDKSERRDRKDDSSNRHDRKDEHNSRFDRSRFGNQRNYRNTRGSEKQRNNDKSPDKSNYGEKKSKNDSSSRSPDSSGKKSKNDSSTRSPDKSNNSDKKLKNNTLTLYYDSKLKTDDLKTKVVCSEAKSTETKKCDDKLQKPDSSNQGRKRIWLPTKSILDASPSKSDEEEGDAQPLSKPTTQIKDFKKPISITLTKPKLPFIGKHPFSRWCKTGSSKQLGNSDERDDSLNDAANQENRKAEEKRKKADEIKREEDEQREADKQKKEEEVRRERKQDEELSKVAQNPIQMFHKQNEEITKRIERAKQIIAQSQKNKEVSNAPVDMDIDDEDKPEESLPGDFQTTLNILFPEKTPRFDKIQVEKLPTITPKTSPLGSIPLPSMPSSQTRSAMAVQGPIIGSGPILYKGSLGGLPIYHGPMEIGSRVINQVALGPTPKVGGPMNPMNLGLVPIVQVPIRPTMLDARFVLPPPSHREPTPRPAPPPPRLPSPKMVVDSVNLVNKKELLLAKEKELQEKIAKQLEMISNMEEAKKNKELDEFAMLGIDADDQAVQKY